MQSVNFEFLKSHDVELTKLGGAAEREPASALLERIKAERAPTPNPKRGRSAA